MWIWPRMIRLDVSFFFLLPALHTPRIEGVVLSNVVHIAGEDVRARRSGATEPSLRPHDVSASTVATNPRPVSGWRGNKKAANREGKWAGGQLKEGGLLSSTNLDFWGGERFRSLVNQPGRGTKKKAASWGGHTDDPFRERGAGSPLRSTT
jgi:hypothetical protein